jgi:hypothetical protein
MKTFDDLTFKSAGFGRSIQAIIMFENGYGISVVQGDHTYGGSIGLYEIAVLDKEGLNYDTPITNDVIGYLTEPEVSDYMIKIQKL